MPPILPVAEQRRHEYWRPSPARRELERGPALARGARRPSRVSLRTSYGETNAHPSTSSRRLSAREGLCGHHFDLGDPRRRRTARNSLQNRTASGSRTALHFSSREPGQPGQAPSS